MKPPLFDTHTHLLDEAFDADREAALERAASAGVRRFVEIADSPSGWPAAVALARARPFIRAGLGLHPYHAAEFTERGLAELEKLVRLPEVAAVGEIGLDYSPNNASTPKELQQQVLERLLAASKEWGMPVVLHCRQAYPDLIALLQRQFHGPPRSGRFWGVVHCFSGTPEEALACAGLGFAIGADGPVTYPKNDLLREAFSRVGPAGTVLETDCPYLPPQSRRGERNEPSLLPEIVERLAQVWKTTVESAAASTMENGKELFRTG
ncbi:MAG: TatD family hydrolase [Elusimicrobia bacterium]|nr:TatD family hydrolase [Elusimicrobiota bacterium]